MSRFAHTRSFSRLADDPESRHNLPMSDEPFGYGDRWWDRMAARRRPGTVFVGVGIIIGMLIIWLG